MARKPEKVRGAVRPNAGITALYSRKLVALLREMNVSVLHWIKASWRANEPKMAQDAVPAAELQDTIDELSKRWRGRFDDAAPELADWFAKSASRRSDGALRSILRRAGITVKFTMTATVRDVVRASVEQNVQLIKSIPEQFLTQVQGAVMRSVQTGRDLGSLTRELQENFGVARRRAEFIALDQNNRATSAMQRARYTELGIEEAIWLHSGGGREPRPSHVANSGKRYNVKTGWYDPHQKEWIWPGTLINCRCVSRPLVKGFT